MRRGYGHSTGPFAETPGPCDNRNYVKAGQEAVADVLGALGQLQKERWVDPKRVVLAGLSMGGFAVVAASAANPAGVRGTLSFAGAVGSPRPDYVCQPDRLIEADQVFGRTAYIPSLWNFAENDHYFAPALARQHEPPSRSKSSLAVMRRHSPPMLLVITVWRLATGQNWAPSKRR